ncbi:MAG: hypothetical protein IT464_15155 [Planctomycetes bacterium]|nr:hypothetical protein [Planctomycetota bacterium]
MQSNRLLTLALAVTLMTATALSAQQIYSNGPLSTGATTQGGTAAPTGYTWSELADDNASINGTIGYGFSLANGIALADDFVVPTGETWTITSFSYYTYSTGAAPTTSPVMATSLQISDAAPSTGTGTVLFGDLTTDRLSTTTPPVDGLIYRCINTDTVLSPGATPMTNRLCWLATVDVSPALVLTAGTYWVAFNGTLTTGLASGPWAPPHTVTDQLGPAGANAEQLLGGTWGPLVDGATPQEIPFRLNGSILLPGNPEIAVLRDGTTGITDGGTETQNGTGTAMFVANYTINNSGTAPLNLTGGAGTEIVIGALNNCTVTPNSPVSSTIAASGSTTFSLNITPTAAGTFSFTISIDNNDSDENPFNWTFNGNTAGGGGGGGGGGGDDGGCSTDSGNSSWLVLFAALAGLGFALRLRKSRA